MINFIRRRAESPVQDVCILLCTKGIYQNQVFCLKSGTHIGRSNQCEIVLKDCSTARLHCTIVRAEGENLLICHGINGVTIDEKWHQASPEKIALKKGAIIQIGEDSFEVLQ